MSQENVHELIAFEFLNNPAVYGIRPGAASDLIRRILSTRPAVSSSGEIIVPGGRSLAEFVAALRDGDGAHLFSLPEVAADRPAVRPDLENWSAEARLSYVNGEPPPLVPTRRSRRVPGDFQ